MRPFFVVVLTCGTPSAVSPDSAALPISYYICIPTTLGVSAIGTDTVLYRADLQKKAGAKAVGRSQQRVKTLKKPRKNLKLPLPPSQKKAGAKAAPAPGRRPEPAAPLKNLKDLQNLEKNPK